MKTAASFLILASALAISGLAQTLPQGAAPPGPPAAQNGSARGYELGPEDELTIQVFEVDDLNLKVQVTQDGSISLPLLGKVQVEGLTVPKLVEKLTTLLQAGYVKNPQVTVFVDAFNSKRVSVIGAVTNPGRYPIIGPKNLLEMISAAGGLTSSASNEALVLRDGPNGNGPSTIAVDLRDLLVNGNQALNIPIEPNDVISVPRDREIKVFVTGRVNEPGTITVKMSEGITLLQAIAGAGGVAKGAKQTAVMVKRLDKDGRETRIKVNLKDVIRGTKVDMRLQEGDVVYVPESFW